MKSSMERGKWVFFQNCHLAPSFMPSLERLVEHINPEKVRNHSDKSYLVCFIPVIIIIIHFILYNTRSKIVCGTSQHIKNYSLECLSKQINILKYY